MSTAKAFLRAHWVAVAFAVLLAIIFTYHAVNRNDHYQECDSSQVYDALTNFPVQSISFTAQISGGSSSFISPARAQAILNLPIVHALTDFYRSKYHVADEQEFNDRIVRALTKLNPLTAFRVALVSIVSQIPLPYFLKSFFALPTATTYSPAPGLFYGLFTGPQTTYGTFMSINLLLTLIIFMIAVIFVFLTARKLGVDPLLSALAATMMLFSVSLYSYAYHLGSTIWNVEATAAWAFFFVKYAENAKRWQKISIATAILAFFSYFVLIYWVAFAAAQLFPGLSWKKMWSFAKSQWLTILAFIIIIIFFYPPGQSYRGIFSLAAIPQYAYYIVLNFFGFYNGGGALNTLQFIIGAALLCAAAWQLFKKNGLAANESTRAFAMFSRWLLGIYILLVACGVLAFYPSRHILAFAPFLFILIAVTSQEWIKKFHVRNGVLATLWIVIIILGTASLAPRTEAMNDRLTIAPVPAGVSKAYIYECTSGLANKNWDVSIPIEVIKPVSFAPQSGGTYLYVSQYVPMTTALSQIYGSEITGGAGSSSIETLSSSAEPSDACFIGFYPSAPGYVCGGFGEPNDLYRSVFTVK